MQLFICKGIIIQEVAESVYYVHLSCSYGSIIVVKPKSVETRARKSRMRLKCYDFRDTKSTSTMAWSDVEWPFKNCRDFMPHYLPSQSEILSKLSQDALGTIFFLLFRLCHFSKWHSLIIYTHCNTNLKRIVSFGKCNVFIIIWRV